MPILPVLSPVSQEVQLNQAYNTSVECDENDVPVECRGRTSLDDKPAEWWDDERDYFEYEHLMHQLYVQGVSASRL